MNTSLEKIYLEHDQTKHDILEEGDKPSCEACKAMLATGMAIKNTLTSSKLETSDQIMLMSNAMANMIVWHAQPGKVSDATNSVLAMITHMVGKMLKRTGQLKGELDAMVSKLGVLASAMMDDEPEMAKAKTIGFRPTDDWKAKN